MGSNPGWTTGQTPTAAEWNAQWSEKADDATVAALAATVSLLANAAYITTYSFGGLCYLSPEDDNSPQFATSNQPAAVNSWLAVGGQTSFAATFAVVGSDTNIDGNFAAKGTGSIHFGNGSGVLAAAIDPGAAPAAWPVLLAGTSQLYPVAYLTAGGSSANMSVGLLPVGNAGAQLGAGNLTSNAGTFAVGASNQATGPYSGAIGAACYASGYYSLVCGWHGNDGQVTKFVWSSCIQGSLKGTNQGSLQSLCTQTTGATASVATANAGSVSAYNSIQLQNNGVTTALLLISAVDTVTGTTGASWWINAAWSRAGSASTVLTRTSTSAQAPGTYWGSASAFTVTIRADTTNGCGTVLCTGAGANAIRWEVLVVGAEVVAG